ncbi:MAG: CvpA family protein [Geminicoccaceae bacterium]
MEQFGVTFLDLGILAVVLISALLALGRGLVREVLSLASWIGAAIVAILFFAKVQPLARDAIANTTLADLAAFGVVFVVPLIAFRITAGVIADIVGASPFRGLDRLGGFAFGAVRGIVIVLIGYLAATSLMRVENEPDWVKNARLMPALEAGAAVVRANLPEKLRTRLEEHDKPIGPSPPAAQKVPATNEAKLQQLLQTN